MAAFRHLGFLKVGNFNCLYPSEGQSASSCQISQRSVEPFRRYGRFSIFNMAAAAILFFGNFKFLTVGTLKRVVLRLRAKFCRNRSNQGWHYGDFSIFHDGGRSPSWIFKRCKFQLPFPFGGPICITVPNFAKIFMRYSRFRIFQDGGCRHLGFWKFQIFNGWDAQEGRTASACQILAKSLKTPLRYGDFSIFQDGGRPPSWIFKSWKF